MKAILKWTFKIVTGLLAGIFLCVLTYYCFCKWRQARMYDDKITVTAYYMHYACGDCSVDMNVKTVDNKKYSFIVGRDIFPTPKTKKNGKLCDFIGSIGYESSTGANYIQESFTLVGHLHKNAHGFPIFDCSETPFFTVDKIKYGSKGQWKDF